MDIGQIILKLFVPLLEFLAPFMPGETFSKFFFEMEIGQQAFLAAMFVTLVSGFLGVFLLTRNLAPHWRWSCSCFFWRCGFGNCF